MYTRKRKKEKNKIKGVIFMLPLVIQLGSLIVGKVVAKEVKKWWEED